MSSSQQRMSVPRRRPALEMVVFTIVSLIGVYALGQALQGLFATTPGGIELGWLAVTLASYWILYLQMCRIQATWPHRARARGKRRSARETRRGS